MAALASQKKKISGLMRRHKEQSKARAHTGAMRALRCGGDVGEAEGKGRAQREGTVVATLQSASRQESRAQAERACVAEGAR